MTYAEIMDLEDAACRASEAYSAATRAFRASRSKVRAEALVEAEDAYSAAIAQLDAARDDFDAEQEAITLAAIAAAEAQDRYLQPSLF